MLVLSRRKDETIMIGDDVEITIVDIKGDTVRVGITAPRSVTVHRKEIYEAIKRENIAAAQQQAVPDKAALGNMAALLKTKHPPSPGGPTPSPLPKNDLPKKP
jgi:carbon storage regulator